MHFAHFPFAFKCITICIIFYSFSVLVVFGPLPLISISILPYPKSVFEFIGFRIHKLRRRQINLLWIIPRIYCLIYSDKALCHPWDSCSSLRSIYLLSSLWRCNTHGRALSYCIQWKYPSYFQSGLPGRPSTCCLMFCPPTANIYLYS